MKTIVFGILFTLLLVSVFMGTLNIQSAKTNASSLVAVQPTDTDWWPMFHHDLQHTGNSTSTAPSTNNTLWNYPIPTGSFLFSSPAVADGMVYVGSGDGNVYALNATTGTWIWNYTTGWYVYSSPAVADGMVYVGSYYDHVYALNATTGTQIWNYTTYGPVESSPAVADGMVYVGSFDYNVYALNATTGTWIWNYTTGGDVDSSPAVADGMVYVGSDDLNVYALNATTGTQIWNYKTGSIVFSSPAVADGMVYVGSGDGNVYALDATTGTQMWNYTTYGGVESSPAVADGMVYVGSFDYNVYALNATTGTWIWNYPTGGLVYSSPAVADGMVYVGSDDYNVYALNTTTGTWIWNYQTGAQVRSSPAVADGRVYVGSYDYKVYCFGSLGTTAPSVMINSPMNVTYATSSIPVNATVTDASGVSTVLAEIDGSNNVTLVPQAGFYVNDTETFAEGTHHVRIFANDTVGNTNSSEVVFFTVDTTAPSVVINSPMNMSYATSSVTINATVTDLTSTVSTVLAEIDGAYNVTLVKQGNFYVNGTVSFTPDGSHHVRIYANDTVGNTNSAESIYFTVDTAAPIVTINSPTNATYATSAITINATATDVNGISTVLAEIDGAYNVTLVKQGNFYVNGTVSFTPDGSHHVRIYANDTVGNTNSAQIVHFTVDTTLPYLISFSPTNHTFQMTNSVNINFRVNDTASGINTGGVVFKVDGSPVARTFTGSNVNGWTFNFTATGLSYEWHTASITVPDQAGNTAAWYIEFATTPVPAISASQTVPPGASTVVGNSTIGVSANVTTTTGSPVVTVANYTGNPAGPATFWALGKYVDVHLDSAAGVSMVEIRVYYTDADVAAVGLNESLLRLYWWNGASWLECSNTGVDTAANYIWAKIDWTSTPNVGQLTGAIFGGGEPYPALTPMPVGGFDVTPNILLVLLQLVGPWIIAVAASAAVIAVVLKKTRKPVHDDDTRP